MTKRKARDGRRRYFTPADRIHKNIGIDPDTGCWNWRQRIHREGYGCFNISQPMVSGKRASKFWLAHRWSYITFVGPIPAGLELDHLCRNRACCNPAHLEPVTRTENTRRGERWGQVSA